VLAVLIALILTIICATVVLAVIPRRLTSEDDTDAVAVGTQRMASGFKRPQADGPRGCEWSTAKKSFTDTHATYLNQTEERTSGKALFISSSLHLFISSSELSTVCDDDRLLGLA